ncbi:MAG: SIMPL domain-containing protein [Lachnospiraceae bacterium]|nr:SIMPL domain-containing protein [Lachnospiraceae bacterium]MBR4174486.1 SIMPL domain-containing protein [Lachnospiraceae bacterium]
MKSRGALAAALLGISAIICVAIFVSGMKQFRKSDIKTGITATGSASCDFEADLVVWRGSFKSSAATSKAAYSKLKRDSELVRRYLLDSGVTDSEMVFSSVNIYRESLSQYNENGDYIGDIPGDYKLNQEVSVSSQDVDKIDKISRDISALIESGVEFTSDSPEYYYTKLDELKLQLIEEATQNAKARVDIVARESGATLAGMNSANLGVFQITATNSASDEYSSGGTFNTSSRNKTASITVKLNYSVK